MITINYTLKNGGVILERPLTEEEALTVTSKLYTGSQAIFYQGDEPNISFEFPKTREVATWKVRSVLKINGLFDTVMSAINSLAEPNKTLANEAFEYSPTINQYSPIVSVIKQSCNLSDEQVNDIFNQAELINI